jgi:hypothetical protein
MTRNIAVNRFGYSVSDRKLGSKGKARNPARMKRDISVAERDHRAFYVMVIAALAFFAMSSVVIALAMI